MTRLWSGLDTFNKICVIIVMITLTVVIVRTIIVLLKYAERNAKFDPPKLLSKINAITLIALTGVIYLVFDDALNYNRVISLVIGVACASVIILINWFFNWRVGAAIKKDISIPYSELKNCVGEAMKQVSETGGLVYVGYKNKFVSVPAVSKEVIKKGKRIKIVDFTESEVICIQVSDEYKNS